MGSNVISYLFHGSGHNNWSVVLINPMKPFTTTTTISTSTSTSATHIYSFRRPSGRRPSTTSSLIVSGYSLNRVEVVTACSWTELVIAADMPVLVEFWAPWCEPSRMLDEVAKEYSGKALCYKLNIEEYPNIASQYGITSIPTVLFYDKGEEKESVAGVVPKSTICATLDKYIE